MSFCVGHCFRKGFLPFNGVNTKWALDNSKFDSLTVFEGGGGAGITGFSPVLVTNLHRLQLYVV